MEGNNNAQSLQKQCDQNSGVLEQLKMQFERKIDWDVILSVAFETGFELRKATTCLNDITNNTNMSGSKAGPTGNENVDRIIETLKRGIKVLILLRGLPGSGKSFLANKLVQESISNCALRDHILSADDYFYSNGNYKYDCRYITEAHRWNQTRAHRLMHDGVSPIIIDNTHTQMWEMKPYCVWGVQYGYMVEILEPETPWAFNERELTKRNKHDVPRNKIRDMMDRYERNLTVQKMFNEFDLRYDEGKLPPQPRKYPPIKVLKEEIYISDDEDVCIDNKEINCKMTNERVWHSIDVDSKSYASVQTNFDYKDIDDPSLKVIMARNNFNNVAILPPMYRKGGILDKGTMTNDEENGKEDLSLDHLVSLFDNKYPLEYIVEIYEKCNKDVEWAIEILLENNKDILENYKPEPKPKAMEIDESVDYELIEVDDSSSDEDRKRLQLERENLKQIIESNFDFNDEHYSEHILQLKHKGKKKKNNMELPKPSTSREENNESDDSDVIIVDSDPDFEDADDNDKFIEFNLGDIFVSQLEQKFGDPNIKYPQGFQPIIEMPKSLGKQLHAMYVESIFKQMDAQNTIIANMIKEDEELARQLQQEEGRITPNFKDIMSEQKVLSKQQSVNEEWKKQTPDDIAYKMSKQKLLESFPDIPSKDLIEILNAHGNSYTQTLEVLRQSGATQVNNMNVSEPPISEETMIEMREAHNKSNEASVQTEVKRTADELREEAAEYHRRRNELLQKAQLYQQRKMTEVAMYYSNLASQQTQKFERANNDAANVILTEHFNRLGAFDTLDLHYLRVPEALTALDLFLDRSIRLLQKEKKENYTFLMILTGRGRNSPGGIPRIKPAVEDRLTARGLKYKLDNPGLIRTKILRTSLMTDNLNDNN